MTLAVVKIYLATSLLVVGWNLARAVADRRAPSWNEISFAFVIWPHWFVVRAKWLWRYREQRRAGERKFRALMRVLSRNTTLPEKAS